DAVAEAFAESMGASVSAEDVTILNVTTTTRRRLAQGQGQGQGQGEGQEGQVRRLRHAGGMHTDAAGIEVDMEMQVVLEMLGFAAADSFTDFQSLKTSLFASMTGGTFAAKLGTALVARGAVVALTVDADSLSVSNVTVTVTQTPTPTFAPTPAPSSGSDSAIPLGIVIPVAAGVLLICLLGVAAAFMMGRSHTSPQKYADEELSRPPSNYAPAALDNPS
ncbi:hypothetical protein B484DRAFT_432877, partial [Ochromonadaceae sp. CCMP2298]